MADDTSDVEAVETEESTNQQEIFEKNESRPIMLVFKKLISKDNSASIIMTNEQIFEILRKEFNIDISALSELEIEIYLNVMKRYLKEWPKWDDFQRVMHRLKSLQYHELLKSSLERKYKLLKNYLHKMLMIARPMATEAAKEFQEGTESNTAPVQKGEGENDVIMEVVCTRDQLNQLFHRHPQGDQSINIFNAENIVQNRIILNSWDILSILNMWNIKVMINLNCLVYKRETKHELKHVLLNKKLGISPQRKIINMNIQEKCKKSKEFNKQLLIDTMENILTMFSGQIKIFTLLRNVFSMIKMDLDHLPDILKVPAHYRQYMHKYPYVRYLYAKDNEAQSAGESDKYDLQLEETIYPMVEYHIAKLEEKCRTFPEFSDWFEIECRYCRLKFTGMNLLEDLKTHFDDKHQNEPDWECANCKKKFEMRSITEQRWSHVC